MKFNQLQTSDPREQKARPALTRQCEVRPLFIPGGSGIQGAEPRVKRTRAAACSQDPKPGPFLLWNSMFGQPRVTGTGVQQRQQSKSPSSVEMEGEGEKEAELCYSRSICRGESCGPKSSFPLSTATEKGEKERETQDFPAEWRSQRPPHLLG